MRKKFLFISVFANCILLIWFVIIPICYRGFYEYVFQQSLGNKVVWKMADTYIQKHQQSLTYEWQRRCKALTPVELEHIEKQKYNTKKINCFTDFFFLDQNAYDCQHVVTSLEWPLTSDAHDPFISKLGNPSVYRFSPNKELPPSYNVLMTDSSFAVKTNTRGDTWVYLVTKGKLPCKYEVEFDFKPKVDMAETLQLVFCMQSLADRFRFALKNNDTMGFSMWKDGNSLLYDTNNDSPLRSQCKLNLNCFSHVKCIVNENKFAIYINGQIVLGISIPDYIADPSYFAFIFWNGFEGGYPIDFEIKNLVMKI